MDSPAANYGTGTLADRKSSSTSQSSAAYAFDCRSPRKLSGASVGSFASSFQDYCRKLSNSSVGAASTAGDHNASQVRRTINYRKKIHIQYKMVNGSRYYRALEGVSVALALSSALTIYPC